MGIFRRRDSRADTSAREERAHPFLAGSSVDTYGTDAGVSVSADTALRLSAVWACTRLLSDTVSTLPIDVYRGTTDNPVAPPTLLQRPSDTFTTIEWLHALMSSLVLRGNAYGVITGRAGAAGWPSQIELVNPDAVSVYRTEAGRISYRIGATEYDRADIFHVRAFTSPGSLTGLSPIEYARQAVGVGLAAETFGARFFGDNATPSGVLISQSPLNPDQATMLKDRWRANHQGRRELAVLSGDVQFVPITISPNESQFVETQRFTVAQIARLFGVPPEMIGGEAGGALTYANVEQRALDFVTFALGPWVARIEAALSDLLPRGQFVKLNTGALLRADLKTRYEAHAIGIASGFLTIDEARALENRAPLPSTPTDTGSAA